MNEEIEYAEMLEIPISTVNVVRKRRRHKKNEQPAPARTLKDTVITSVNDRLREEPDEIQVDADVFAEGANSEGSIDFDIPERIDTVRLYSTGEAGEGLSPEDYPLTGDSRATGEPASKPVRIALGVETGLICALCCGIFLTNVFLPGSAINTFFRSLNTPAAEAGTPKHYTDFALTPVVSELSDAKLSLSESGVLSFTDECCVYPAADGKMSEIVQGEDGLYTVKIHHSDTFTGVIQGLDVVYYAVGDNVKANVPVGYTDGEGEVRVTMYSDGALLNCFQLTEENCLAWIPTDA